jgi:hypothetical protein
MALSKELKEAILEIAPKEKDKLLLKLLAKDEKLVKKLEYELIEQGSTLNARREEVVKAIDSLYKFKAYSSGYLMMDMRYVNARISEHVKITTDKYGEVELTLKLLRGCFEKQFQWIESHTSASDNLCSYVAKKTQFLVGKIKKIHPDLQYDFFEELNKLLSDVHDFGPKNYARELKIPKVYEINYEDFE